MNTQGKGYVFAAADGSDFYIPDALHIERDDELFLYEDDAEAARAAEQEGVRLIHGMDGVPDGVYLDTPENREVIQTALEQFPEYRYTPPEDGQTPEDDVHFSLL